jgi:4-amino-4-deoxy-L-arabinose transferase-like glycosyltransferase
MRLRGAGPVLAVLAAVVALMPVLTESSKPLSRQTYPDSWEYADAAWQLAHGHGYVTYVNDFGGPRGYGRRARPPRYPFGTSAVLAPFTLVFGRLQGAQVGARVLVGLYVISVIAAAWLLGGSLAAIIAAVLSRSSPFVGTESALILSDPLGATLVLVALIGIIRGSKLWVLLAGVAAGASLDVRILGIVAIPAAVLAVPGRRRWLVPAGAAPFVVLLAYYQWHAFGSPFRTGYSYWLPHLRQFSLSFVTGALGGSDETLIRVHGLNLVRSVCGCRPLSGSVSNLIFYPAVLSGLLWAFAPPLTGLIGLVALIRRRATPPARFALTVIVLNVAVLLVYFYQGARLAAPGASLLLVYGAAELATYMKNGRRRLISAASSDRPAAPFAGTAPSPALRSRTPTNRASG